MGPRVRRSAGVIGVMVAAVCVGAGSHNARADAPAAPPAPTLLTLSDRTQPLDVDGPPQFGWLPGSAKGNDVQSAYEIVVTTPGGAAVWDSGKVASDAESYVPYAGPALERGTAYDWTVRTWDRDGQASPYAPVTHFDTGIADGDWSGAQWIRRVTTGNDTTSDYSLYRKAFKLTGSPVTRARAYLAASAGKWDLRVNGASIDTQYDYQAPGETYYDVKDITSAVQTSGGDVALGVKYANWATTEGEPRPEGPVPTSTKLGADAAAGATTITVAATTSYAVGENLGLGTPNGADFEVATIKSISANVITLAAPLAKAHASGSAVISENGPSGLLAKVVVDHADGTQQVIVSDPSWLVAKDTFETTSTVKRRSATSAGSYVEYTDARTALTGWDTVGYTPTAAWVPATPMGAHPLPNPSSCTNYLSHGSPCGLTHLVPMESRLSYRTVHPTSVETLADGTVEADFGAALVGVPVLHVEHGTAGNTVDMDGSYRLDHSTLDVKTDAGASTISVPSAHFIVKVGDTVTVDAPPRSTALGTPRRAR